EFRSAADDTRPFLVCAGKVAGNVDESDDRDGERIAEAHEAARLLTRLDVQGSRHLRGLVGDDADRTSFDAAETDDDVRCEQRLNLDEVTIVDDMLDDRVNVVG